MNAAGHALKNHRQPRRCGRGLTCAPRGVSAGGDTGKACKQARSCAVQGETDLSNVVSTTQWALPAAFGIARIGG